VLRLKAIIAPPCLCLALFVVAWLFLALLTDLKYPTAEQQQLAAELGINPAEYPPARVFPYPYFAKVLQVGMTIQNVHAAVHGYKASYRCSPDKEIYYFLTTGDDTALRFEIYYDQERRFEKIVGEDDDSRTIRTEGCEPGLLLQ
jgi:hypothetical protein